MVFNPRNPAFLGAASGGDLTEATGGTITEVGDYRIHTFTTVETTTFSVTKAAPAPDNVMDVVVVAGGGGGGAGGYSYETGKTLAVADYTVTVGAGGNGQDGASPNGANGGDSVFDDITSDGGGYAGSIRPS